MKRMLFAALVASIAVGVAGAALAGSPAHDAKAKRKQQPGKLKIARVVRVTSTPAGEVSDLVTVPCPPHYRVTGGAVSPGANLVAVSAPDPGRQRWVGAVGNPSTKSAAWELDVVCAKGGNKYLKVVGGGEFQFGKRAVTARTRQQYDEFKQAFQR
jgi:hypothetical protein